MTDFTSQFSSVEHLRSGLRRMFAAIGRYIEDYGRAKSRRDLYEALEAKSDAELAALGIRRDQIAQYVFRDLLYV